MNTTDQSDSSGLDSIVSWASMSDAPWIILGTILPLLFLSACLSGTETALTAASRGRLHQLSSEGHLGAKMASSLVADPDRLLAAILIGNNLVNILATALATFALVQIFGEKGVLVATLAMTGLIVIFAEILPKTYAMGLPETIALRAAAPTRGLLILLWPVLAIVLAMTGRMKSLLGVEPDSQDAEQSVQQEVLGTIELGHQAGALVKRDRDMLVAALELSETEISDVMTPRGDVEMVDADADGSDIFAACLATHHTRIPLWRGTRDHIIGVVNCHDLFRNVYDMREDDPDLHGLVAETIASEPDFVPENRSLAEQLRIFQSTKSRFAIVVDEYGDFQGVVSLEDILEDIVGNISEEHASKDESFERCSDGSVVVDGAITVRDLNREYHWNLPDEEATTVAGLVIHEAQCIPTIGQQFNFHGFRFEILGRTGNRISKLVIRPLGPSPSATLDS